MFQRQMGQMVSGQQMGDYQPTEIILIKKNEKRHSQNITHSVNHGEVFQKIISCWHLTPYRLAKFSPENSCCWRCCDQSGTLLYILWSCKGLTSYWNKVFQLISQITEILTKPESALALLHLGIEHFPHNSSMSQYLSSQQLRCSSEVRASTQIVNLIYSYEKSIALRTRSLYKFNQTWNTWMQMTSPTVV